MEKGRREIERDGGKMTERGWYISTFQRNQIFMFLLFEVYHVCIAAGYSHQSSLISVTEHEKYIACSLNALLIQNITYFPCFGYRHLT